MIIKTYRRVPHISPWAYTLVVVFCGLIHGGGLELIHGGFKSVRIFIRNCLIGTFFLKLACISMIFVRHGLIHGYKSCVLSQVDFKPMGLYTGGLIFGTLRYIKRLGW